MGNAPEVVKRAAARVTSSDAEDGVTQAIEEIFAACPDTTGQPGGA